MGIRRIRKKDDDEVWDSIYDFLENADREYRRMFERWFDTFDEMESLKGQPGSYVYGFTYRVGPDGKPVFQEFGNVPKEYSSLPSPEYREPVTDIQERENELDITMEIPGVDKSDISLDVQNSSLVVKVDKNDRKYYKEIELEEEVDQENIKATYSNGVLDIIVKKASPKKSKGKKIPIS
ncbi:MAG: Hsp20/alpha crystallin family protein [Candidatus Thermoplasmatota archaeon]|jgi:HSP20 family protein|nr:Hsp20/alpha crystallin family protein [Candidatus Thermoplasmatota archaeon]